MLISFKNLRAFGLSLLITLFLTGLSPSPLSAQIEAGLPDEELLELISRKAFDYFVMEADRGTGLVQDKAHNFKRKGLKAGASIAATGFGLTALGVGVERSWIDYASASERVRRTLQFFLRDAPQEHGFFYHFLDPKTGKRYGKSELSPIDTALLLAGALFAAEYFEDAEIRKLAEQIYERVDWPWMLHDGIHLALAWSPEEGFNRRRWDHYDESMILYLLAIGSPSHPIPAESWKEMLRPVGSYGEYKVIQMPPLFTHQYSHAWIDFRDKNDGFADYFQNSVNATLANKKFCLDESRRFSTYGPDSWGLSASDGPFGYRAYGAPPGWAVHDGTVAPTACGGSIVFTPDESIACLRNFYETHGEKLWGLYGFSDAFNLDKDWFSQEAIGINQGALLLMIENYRSGLIWKKMSQSIVLNDAMQKVGFIPGTKEIPWAEVPVYEAPFVREGIKVDSYLKDWLSPDFILLNKKHLESGHIQDGKDLQGQVRFAWSREALYFSVIVKDESILLRSAGKHIYRDDIVELYIDPQGDGLFWENRSDFQIGFRPNEDSESVSVQSWFQGSEDSARNMIAARGYIHKDGYVIEGGIRWSYLGVDPVDIKRLKVSLAIHDIDKDRSEGKVHWFFRSEDGAGRFNLGEIILKRGDKP